MKFMILVGIVLTVFYICILIIKYISSSKLHNAQEIEISQLNQHIDKINLVHVGVVLFYTFRRYTVYDSSRNRRNKNIKDSDNIGNR